jgi:hypothetical protein
MLYELVGGRRPFAGQTVAELRRAHVTEAPAPLDAIAPGVPRGVSEAVARAMAKDRSQRQATPGQLIREVEAGLAAGGKGRGLRPGAGAPIVIDEARRDGASRGRARARAAGLWLGALLVLAGTGGYAVWEGPEVASEPPVAGAILAPATAEAGRVLGYRLVAQRYRGRTLVGDEFRAEVGDTFGAEVGLRLAVSSPQEGYLYVLGEAPQPDRASRLPRYTVFYPRPDTNGGTPQLEAGHDAQVPGEDQVSKDEEKFLRFTGKPGTETLWLVWSAQELSALAGLQKGRVEAEAQILALREVLSAGGGREPSLEVDDTGQTIVWCEGDVLVHAIRLAHR